MTDDKENKNKNDINDEDENENNKEHPFAKPYFKDEEHRQKFKKFIKKLSKETDKKFIWKICERCSNCTIC